MLIAFFSIVSFLADAQTVEEVIQKCITKHGGPDDTQKIKTAKLTGTATAQGNTLSLTIHIINGRAIRSDIEVMGTRIISVYKDGKGWRINPKTGSETPEDLSGPELTELKNQSTMASHLMNYKAAGHQVELLGQEDVDGKKAFKVKLTNKEDGKVTTYYIDAADYSIIKSIADREFAGNVFPVETWYSDIKDFNGFKFYMTRIQKLEGQEIQAIRFESLELGIPIDEKIFEKP